MSLETWNTVELVSFLQLTVLNLSYYVISLIIFCKLLILFHFDLCSLINLYFCFNLIMTLFKNVFLSVSVHRPRFILS